MTDKVAPNLAKLRNEIAAPRLAYPNNAIEAPIRK